MTTTGQLNRVRLDRIVNGLPPDPLTTPRPTEASQRTRLLSEIDPAELAQMVNHHTHGATPTPQQWARIGAHIHTTATLAILATKKAAQKGKK